MTGQTPEGVPDLPLGGSAPDAEPSRFSDLLFGYRLVLHALIYCVGFLVSFSVPRSVASQRVWLALPAYLAAHFTIGLNTAVVTITVLAIALAFAGALLRTWGNAYLGAGVVFDPKLRSTHMVIGGPYRFLRNPLYLGTVLHTLALCVLMTWPGAVLTLVLVVALQAALIRSEERYLTRSLGEDYAEYTRAVPRLFPKLGVRKVVGGQMRGSWARAVASEVYMWGAAISFAVFGWTYNPVPILQGLLISFGLAIVVRGLVGQR